MYISANDGKKIVRNYQNDSHSKIGSEWRLYTRDASGEKIKLKSWWISIADLNQIIADTTAYLQANNKGPLTGVRFYPSLQSKNEQGTMVPDYHTLTYVCTYQAPNGSQDNVLLANVMDFCQPCPTFCNTDPNAELGY
jgi:hypothetical protein